MIAVGTGLAASLAALVALLAALGASAGLGFVAWAAGLACGVAVTAAIAHGLARHGAAALGPADLVTLTRSTLTCGVAALVAESFVQPSSTRTLVALAVTALLLDAVDGRVARRTRTSSPFGARFDGEADAFLILVLSVYVARSFGAWVLLIGAARYVFAVAGWVSPWLREQLPFRYWRKVVAAVQGVVLTFAAADVAPAVPTYAALVVALALLTESFGRDVLWLWSHRPPERVRVVSAAGPSRLRQP